MYSSQDQKRFRSNKIGLALTLSVLLFAHASAWTYVPVSDENMVTTSDSIIIGVVQEELSSGSIDVGGIYRHYKIQPVEELKGTGKRSIVEPVIVHVNGGIDHAGNRTLHVPGAPSFAPGQNVLLFLSESGFSRLSHFALGAFYRISVSNKRDQVSVAVRRHEVEDAVQAGLGLTFARDFDQFTGYIRRVVSGEESTEVQNDDHGFSESTSNYVVEGLSPDDLLSALEATEPNAVRYNLFTSSNGLNPRWKVFDTAGSVSWLRHTSGMPGLANGGVQEAIDCMDSWNSNPNSPVNYQLTGTTTNINGLKNSDRLNTILYEDPGNVISGSYSCRTGGTLAMGGWYSSGTHSFRGSNWVTIIEGDIVMQDGISCWFTATSNPVASYSNMLTHEMGHTLGLAHSCNTGSTCVAGSDADKAIMRSSAHNNGGRTLQADDIAGIEFLYAPCAPNCPAAGPAAPTPAPAATTRAATTRAATTRAATTARAAATTSRATSTTRAASTTRAVTTSRVVAAPTTAALPVTRVTTGRRKWWLGGGASEVTGTEETNEDPSDEIEESVGLDDNVENSNSASSALACVALVASALVLLL